MVCRAIYGGKRAPTTRLPFLERASKLQPVCCVNRLRLSHEPDLCTFLERPSLSSLFIHGTYLGKNNQGMADGRDYSILRVDPWHAINDANVSSQICQK